MCHKVTCDVCGKPTWEGCGDHIEHALGDVPVSDRCHCKAFQGTDTPARVAGFAARNKPRPNEGTSVSSW